MGFITDFGKKKRNQSDEKDAIVTERAGLFIDLVRFERPCRNGEKRDAQAPAQCVGGEICADPGAEQAGEAVIGQRCDEYAQDNGHWFAKAGGEQKCEQLRFVADLADGDHQC